MDTRELRRLLEKATPGEWYAYRATKYHHVKAKGDKFGDHYIMEGCYRGLARTADDARLIAAAVNALPALLDRLAAVEAELAGLTAQYEERTAYTIVHRGRALLCSDSMRAAYSDEHHRAEKAEAELAALRARIAGAPVGVTECCDAKGAWLVMADDAKLAPGQRVRLLPEPTIQAGGE